VVDGAGVLTLPYIYFDDSRSFRRVVKSSPVGSPSRQDYELDRHNGEERGTVIHELMWLKSFLTGFFNSSVAGKLTPSISRPPIRHRAIPESAD
jgi:hypothetical protein